ncbi:MAG: hypothetical protein EBR52_03060 [Microbacteriaceae bacterium]|nr:hypothetical protein [Microbacteriaceae bacterium]
MTVAPTAYESFLNLPAIVLFLIVLVPGALIMWACIRFYRRQEVDQNSYPLASATLSIVGGAFIFIGAFSLVTSWDTQAKMVGAVTSEFTSVTSLAEDLGSIPGDTSKAIALSFADYARMVRDTEIGTAGVVGPNPEAQKALAVIERSVTALAESPGLTAHQVDNLYTHLESVKDARKERLMISVPNLPLSVNALLLVSAILTWVGVGLFPASRVRWFTYLYGGATVLVSSVLIVSVLTLQSPVSASDAAMKPVEMFLTSVSEGGANIDLNNPSSGASESPAPALPPQSSGQPLPGQPQPNQQQPGQSPGQP